MRVSAGALGKEETGSDDTPGNLTYHLSAILAWMYSFSPMVRLLPTQVCHLPGCQNISEVTPSTEQ